MPAHASRTLATAPSAPSAPPSDACSLRHRPANAGTPAELSGSPASRPLKLRSVYPGLSSVRGAWSGLRQRLDRLDAAELAAIEGVPGRGIVIRAVEAWVADWNEHPRPFIWHKTADQIFDNLTGYLNRIPNSGH